jgi:hypothetical protein
MCGLTHSSIGRSWESIDYRFTVPTSYAEETAVAAVGVDTLIASGNAVEVARAGSKFSTLRPDLMSLLTTHSTR